MCMCEPGDGTGTACSNCGELGCNGECTGTGGSGSLTETEAFNQLSSEKQDEIITCLIANNLYY